MSIQVEAFQLAPRVSAEAFMKADEAFEQWSYANRPGIARRTTARNGDDWLVVTIWSHVDDNATSGEHEMAWREQLESASYRTKFYETL